MLVVATKPSACLLLRHPLVKTFLLTQVRRKEPVLETSGQFIEVLVHDGLGVVLSFVELAQDCPRLLNYALPKRRLPHALGSVQPVGLGCVDVSVPRRRSFCPAVCVGLAEGAPAWSRRDFDVTCFCHCTKHKSANLRICHVEVWVVAQEGGDLTGRELEALSVQKRNRCSFVLFFLCFCVLVCTVK